jgi:multiple sugar transport system permease protein
MNRQDRGGASPLSPVPSPAKLRGRGGRLVAPVLVHAMLGLLAAFALFPLLWMLAVSLMAPGEASAFPPPLLPSAATLGNYRALFEREGIARTLGNSFALAAMATVLSLAFNTTAGYAFARLPLPGREKLFRLLMMALVIPGQVAMLPLFLMLKSVGLVNTWAGVLVPGLAGIFGIFLVREAARAIPLELIEAARIEGAGELRIFFSIVLPLLKPILVTLAIFTFLASWNDFMWPLIVLTDSSLQTLPVALAGLSREHVQDNEMMMAGAVLTILPPLLVFLALQRYYLRGLLMGSVKG